jgi:hypothetical protein
MEYNEKQLRIALSELEPLGPGRFGYLVARRLQPLYRLFTNDAGWGSPAFLDEGLHVAQARLQGEAVDAGSLRELAESTLRWCPRVDDWESPHTSFAIYASAAVHYTLLYLATTDINSVVYIGRNQYEAAEEYASVNIDRAEVAALSQLPVVQQELDIQRRLLIIAKSPIDQGISIAVREGMISEIPEPKLIWES